MPPTIIRRIFSAIAALITVAAIIARVEGPLIRKTLQENDKRQQEIGREMPTTKEFRRYALIADWKSYVQQHNVACVFWTGQCFLTRIARMPKRKTNSRQCREAWNQLIQKPMLADAGLVLAIVDVTQAWITLVEFREQQIGVGSPDGATASRLQARVQTAEARLASVYDAVAVEDGFGNLGLFRRYLDRLSLLLHPATLPSADDGADSPLKRLRDAAKAGDADAMNRLGLIYLNGEGGLGKDEVAAAQWFMRGAKAGSAASP